MDIETARLVAERLNAIPPNASRQWATVDAQGNITSHAERPEWVPFIGSAWVRIPVQDEVIGVEDVLAAFRLADYAQLDVPEAEEFAWHEEPTS